MLVSVGFLTPGGAALDFDLNRQEYLIAYRPPTEDQMGNATLVEFLVIDFYKVGTHENFYDELKRYLREE